MFASWTTSKHRRVYPIKRVETATTFMPKQKLTTCFASKSIIRKKIVSFIVTLLITCYLLFQRKIQTVSSYIQKIQSKNNNADNKMYYFLKNRLCLRSLFRSLRYSKFLLFCFQVVSSLNSRHFKFPALFLN